MLMITTYLPVLHSNLPPVVRSHHIWTPVWILSLLILAPKTTFRNRLFLYVMIYLSILVFILNKTLWSGMYDWYKEQALGELYIFVIAFSIWVYFLGVKDFEGMAVVAKWTLVFIGITAVLSIYSSFIDPLYARKITGGELEEIEEIISLGGGAYGFAGALLCLFPVLIYYYRRRIFPHRNIIIVFAVICFIALIRMQIFANIIISAIVIIFSLAGRERLKGSIITSLLLLAVLLIIPDQAYSKFLKFASSYFIVESETYLKLNDLSEYIIYGGYEGMMGSRMARYTLLLRSFTANPLLGHFHTNISTNILGGAHLYWMSKLTIYGFIGFVPFILIFYYHIRRNLKYYDPEYTFYYLMSVLSIIMLGLVKNLAGRELFYMLFFVLPSLYFLPLVVTRKSGYTPKNWTAS